MTKRQKYGLIAILLALALYAPLAAQNSWEGTAVVGRYGEFPPGGLYVASNTFPLNSMVNVTNTGNGKSARLIVAKTVDDPGVFMLLSEAAAGELGVTSRETVGVRVEPVQLPGLTSVNPNQDLPFHPDPDINPAASLGDPNASIIRPGDPAAVAGEAGQPDSPSVVDSGIDEEDFSGDGAVVGTGPSIAATLDEATGGPDVSMPRVNPTPEPPLAVALALPPDTELDSVPGSPALATVLPVEGDPLVERLAEVEKELRREQIAAAPLQTGETPLPEIDLSGAIMADAGSEAPKPPNPVSVTVELPIVEDLEAPEAVVVAPEPRELAADEIALPLVPVERDAPRPTRIPDDAIVTLKPADYRSPDPPPEPPEPEEPAEPAETEAAPEVAGGDDAAEADVEPETEPEAVAAAPAAPEIDDERTWARANLPLITGLRAGSSYVQVAAFSNPRSAKQTIDQLGERYPVAVLSQDDSERSVYRIFVGPLNEDEKGSALYTVRNRGFRDAFVRDNK